MFKTHPEPSMRMERLLPALETQLEKYARQPNNADRFAEIMRAHVQRYEQTRR